MAEEAVLADSGRAGEIAAGAGRVKQAVRFEHPYRLILGFAPLALLNEPGRLFS
jgi:hypothetical protein